MMVFDRENLRIVAVNEAAIRHYGYSREEFLAMTVKDIRPPGDVPVLVEALGEMDGGRRRFTGRHRKKDGAVIDVEVYAAPEMWGTRTVVLTQILDVTERRRSKAKFQQLWEAAPDALAFGRLRELKNRLAEEKSYLEEELRTEHNFDEVIGESPGLKRVLQQVETVAPSDATVLILGETGTGKELIARAIHDLSPRRERTFVTLNCAAIPIGLLESDLFGHEKGAFTGAISQKLGRLELAHGGTLFLDEVGEIPLEIQSKLLRVLQEKEFERLGSTNTISVHVRLIAATNRDLPKMVETREFRSDLYYRLTVFPITVPPLRARPEDIPLLVWHFVAKFAKRMSKRIEIIEPEAIDALQKWHWPGNVRELENFIERSVILSHGPVLHVPLAELQSLAAPQSTSSLTLEAQEREHILRVLQETGGVVGGPHGAAARLGIPRTTLNAKMRRHGIFRKYL